jgi:transcriptional regulator with XRE-family HTH domain
MESFGQRLRRIRNGRGVSGEALAAAVGVSGSAIRLMETGGTRQARLDVGVLIAYALDVTPLYLVFGDHAPVVKRLGKAKVKA